MVRGKALSTPLPPYVKLSHKDSRKLDGNKVEMDKIPYASTVGSLMYDMIATSLHIASAVGVISTYMANLDKKHWEAVKGMMHYLRGTQVMCICFSRQDACVLGYTDQIMQFAAS